MKGISRGLFCVAITFVYQDTISTLLVNFPLRHFKQLLYSARELPALKGLKDTNYSLPDTCLIDPLICPLDTSRLLVSPTPDLRRP